MCLNCNSNNILYVAYYFNVLIHNINCILYNIYCIIYNNIIFLDFSQVHIFTIYRVRSSYNFNFPLYR